MLTAMFLLDFGNFGQFPWKKCWRQQKSCWFWNFCGIISKLHTVGSIPLSVNDVTRAATYLSASFSCLWRQARPIRLKNFCIWRHLSEAIAASVLLLWSICIDLFIYGKAYFQAEFLRNLRIAWASNKIRYSYKKTVYLSVCLLSSSYNS